MSKNTIIPANRAFTFTEEDVIYTLHNTFDKSLALNDQKKFL
ncbi:hypothetical protein [Rickettsia endosymbiont of Nabis limbatus]